MPFYARIEPHAILQDVVADSVLTVTELDALPSCVTGSASFYTETLHPYGGAQATKLTLVGTGTLEDGRRFRIQASAQERSAPAGSSFGGNVGIDVPPRRENPFAAAVCALAVRL